MQRPASLSSRYQWMADRIDAGHRETPQRFRPLAFRLLRESVDGARIESLCAFVLAQVAYEGGAWPEGHPSALPALVRRARSLLLLRQDAGTLAALQADVLALAPERYRRRSIHCHGRVASDRALLVLRTMLPVLGMLLSWVTPEEAEPAWSIETFVAYYVSDYAYDHFVFTGPAAAARCRLIAAWCERAMPGG